MVEMEPGRKQMGTDRSAQLICQMMDDLRAAAGCNGRGGMQAWPVLAASSLRHFSLFLLNLSQKAPVLPFSGCAWLSDRLRCWWEDRGLQGPRATPSPSLGPGKPLAPSAGG